MSDKREISEIWFQRVWAEEDTTAIDEMLVPDTEARGLADHGARAPVGPEEFKAFHRALLALLGNVRIEICRFMEQDDWAAMVCRLTATARATGQPVEIDGQITMRIDGGKLIEADNHWDFIGLFEQLGLLPQDTFGQCLGGQNRPRAQSDRSETRIG